MINFKTKNISREKEEYLKMIKQSTRHANYKCTYVLNSRAPKWGKNQIETEIDVNNSVKDFNFL